MFKVRNYAIHPDLWYDPRGHFWLQIEGNRARLGLDPLEQETRGAVVVVQLEAAGTALSQGDSFGSIEAEKHVGMLRSPLSGKIVAVNPAVQKNPRLVNSDCYGEGWLVEMELSHFEKEQEKLLTGEAALRGWFEAEIKKYEELGWLAES